MNNRSTKGKTNGKKLPRRKKVFAVEDRANKTPEELLLGIRDKIQEILRR